MDVIERYVYAVTRKLPERQRKDVARELTSDIEAMVADKAGHEPTEAIVKQVLQELGDPEKFAAQYTDAKRYLIGPRYFDAYVTLLKNLLLIVPITVAIAVIVLELAETRNIAQLLAEAAYAAINVAIHIFLWVTVIIAAVERVDAKPSKDRQPAISADWTPDQLPIIPKERQIPKSEAMAGVVWSILAIIGVLWQIPFIHQAIAPNVPLLLSDSLWPVWLVLLLLLSVSSLAVELVKLAVGVWNKLTVWLIAVLNSLTIILFGLLIGVRPLISDEFIASVAKNGGDVGLVEQIATNAFIIFCLMVIAFSLYEMIKALWVYKKR